MVITLKLIFTNSQTRLGNIQVGTTKKSRLLCKINALESHGLTIGIFVCDYLERMNGIG